MKLKSIITTLTSGIILSSISTLSAFASLGDLNSDGEINALDASHILTAYAMAATSGNSGLNSQQVKDADINSDGEVNALDASWVLSYYAYCATSEKPESIEKYKESLSDWDVNKPDISINGNKYVGSWRYEYDDMEVTIEEFNGRLNMFVVHFWFLRNADFSVGMPLEGNVATFKDSDNDFSLTFEEDKVILTMNKTNYFHTSSWSAELSKHTPLSVNQYGPNKFITPFTQTELKNIANQLGVPANLSVTYKTENYALEHRGIPGLWLTPVEIIYNGKTVAYAQVNADTKEPSMSISAYGTF